MRALIPRVLLASVPLVVLVVLLLPSPRKTVAGAPTQLYLDLAPTGGPGGLSPMVGPIPPNGSGWHELFPAFCAMHHQDDYRDNGNGIVDSCDVIVLDGIPYHIVWAGPTYFVTCSTDIGGPPLGTNVFEPTGPPQTGNPVCQVWHEIWPNFCREIHIDSFHDMDGNGQLNECDYVDNQPHDPGQPPVIFYHIDRIGLDITVVPVPDTPTKPSTWSNIKSFFEGIVH